MHAAVTATPTRETAPTLRELTFRLCLVLDLKGTDIIIPGLCRPITPNSGSLSGEFEARDIGDTGLLMLRPELVVERGGVHNAAEAGAIAVPNPYKCVPVLATVPGPELQFNWGIAGCALEADSDGDGGAVAKPCSGKFMQNCSSTCPPLPIQTHLRPSLIGVLGLSTTPRCPSSVIILAIFRASCECMSVYSRYY